MSNPGRADFASDTVAGAMPEVMQALVEANTGVAAGYGADHVTARAADLVRELLDADAEVRFVVSGTAANAFCLAALTQPFESVLAHGHAHAATHETGAPAFFGSGLGVIGLGGASGRIDPAALDAALAEPEVSYMQPPAALSLTNATEYGAVYTLDAVRVLTGKAKAKGLKVHLDGARLANACASGFDAKAIAGLGVDALVLGGTKAGSTPSEAIVFFDKRLGRRLDQRLKHMGQLVSKGRFLAAPWIGMLESGAWLARAAHANAMAQRLVAAMPFPILHPVESNGVFVAMDDDALARLHASGWFAYRFIDGGVRFMTSWATTPEAVDELSQALRNIA